MHGVGGLLTLPAMQIALHGDVDIQTAQIVGLSVVPSCVAYVDEVDC